MIKYFFLLALNNLRRRKLRSWLTIIGIFIGIAAVVSLISLGEGLQEAIDEQFNLLYEELIHNQEIITYQNSDLLNFENLPKVLMELGIKCTLNDLKPILKLLSSRGITRIGNFLEIATPRRIETIRNTYISSLGHRPNAIETCAALVALKGVKTSKIEIERIKSQIDIHKSNILQGEHQSTRISYTAD